MLALLEASHPNQRRERQLIKAFRSLHHAMLYLGPDDDEKAASGTLELAKREVYKEKFQITRYAQWSHFCGKCSRYRDAQR